jgi:YVTN family beta-propeller protein
MLALSPDGARLAAINSESGSITLLSTLEQRVEAEVPVGERPTTLAFTPDGLYVLVAVSGADGLVVVEAASARVITTIPITGQPHGVVSEAGRAYVSQFALGQIAVVDLAARTVAGFIPVEPFPTGLALAGGSLYVTHRYTGRITQIDRAALTVQRVIATDPESNLADSIALIPDGRRAYLPQTLSHADTPALRPEAAVSPVVNVLDLARAAYRPDARIALAQPDHPVNLPLAAVVSPDGRWLFVANAGTDDISVISLTSGRALGVIAAGRHPRGLALSRDGAHLFILNVLDGALGVVALRYHEGAEARMPQSSHLAAVSLTTLVLPDDLLTGQRLFNTALPPLSTGWLSCATCHFEGGHDARTWRGFPDGPRNTPSLLGSSATAPFHWSGDLDELQDTEDTVRRIQGGAGLIAGEVHAALGPANAGRSAALDALAAYMAALRMPASPHRVAPEVQARGERAFRRWGCAACHTAPLYTDQQRHASEIGDPSLERNPLGLRMDTPSLRGVWATAPYFHDGSAATLRDTFFQVGFHGMGYAMGSQEVDDLVAFLQSR